jgi:hypothetical protein
MNSLNVAISKENSSKYGDFGSFFPKRTFICFTTLHHRGTLTIPLFSTTMKISMVCDVPN